MLTIRLARGGAKRNPYYRLVVTDSRNARDSGAIKEKVGHFNPVAQGEEVMLHMDAERVQYWISKGAQASSKAAQLIKIFNKAQQSGEKAVMRPKPKKAKLMPEEAKTEAVAEDTAPEEAKTEAAAEEKTAESDTKDGDA